MEVKYEDSLFYQINSTAKCFDVLSNFVFKELNLGISAVEYLAMGIIAQTKDCCQRDLARIILKDRANTGKLAKKLEEKGMIEINLKSKNNKLVKILALTKKGIEIRKQALEKLMPIYQTVLEEVTENKIGEMTKALKDFKQIVQKTVKFNI